MLKIKRALISVSDKTGIIELAKELKKLDVEIISTGGTCKILQEAGIPVTYISEVTKFPEILDGRVKTLNPRIHGGILAVRDKAEHLQQLVEHHIEPIDLVVVNLYPFGRVIKKEGVTLDEAIENIDIGGPSMIRAAAKNYKYVTVITNPAHYERFMQQLSDSNGELNIESRFYYAVEAFKHTADYDRLIADYLELRMPETWEKKELNLRFVKVQDLRYGENPHQQAAFYKDPDFNEPSVATAKQLYGKELSFNNIIDLNAALELVREYNEPAAVVIKHTNPCGAATAEKLVDAYRTAFAADELSAFGGVIGLNRVVDAATAEEINKTFIEAVIAPDFDGDALHILKQKKNIRLLEVGALTKPKLQKVQDFKRVVGGLLVQDSDVPTLNKEDWKVVTDRQPTEAEWKDLMFAWTVAKHVKSNAIVLAKNAKTVGVGAGQMSRIDSVKIAVSKAEHEVKGTVLASDAFFPFRDSVDEAARYGITAIIQPGGSIRDEDAIEAANEHGIAMIFTNMRHFKH